MEYLDGVISEFILLEKKIHIIESKENKRKKIKEFLKKTKNKLKDLTSELFYNINDIDKKSLSDINLKNLVPSDILTLDSFSFDLISGSFNTLNLYKKVNLKFGHYFIFIK